MKRIDISLLFSVALLTFFGLFMIYDVSSYVAFRDFGDKYHYVKDQSIWVILGFVGLLFFSNFNYRRLKLLALPILFVALTLLILVFVPGVGIRVLGSGGLMGVGLGNSLQKYAYLPESTTDSIFAIIAEELGFIGATFLILFYIFIVWRCFYIAMHAKDNFGKLLAGRITTFLAIQTFINLAAQTALIPLTGIPLPFISYGGSALIIDLCSIGILLSISSQSHDQGRLIPHKLARIKGRKQTQ